MDINKPKILFIEDEFFIHELYKNELQKAGFEVIAAFDGDQALQLSLDPQIKNNLKLILLDIMLPKLNGLDLLKKLKQNATIKDIPIVLLTNLGDKQIIKEAFDNGAQGYYMKVRITPKKLVEDIQKYMSNTKYIMDYNLIPLDE